MHRNQNCEARLLLRQDMTSKSWKSNTENWENKNWDLWPNLISAAIVALTAAATILTNSGFTLAEEIKKIWHKKLMFFQQRRLCPKLFLPIECTNTSSASHSFFLAFFLSTASVYHPLSSVDDVCMLVYFLKSFAQPFSTIKNSKKIDGWNYFSLRRESFAIHVKI